MEKPLKIPAKSLPKGWRQIGADHFKLSASMVEKVVYGIAKNDDVFKYMLQLAQDEKWRRDKEAIDLQLRIDKLTK